MLVPNDIDMSKNYFTADLFPIIRFKTFMKSHLTFISTHVDDEAIRIHVNGIRLAPNHDTLFANYDQIYTENLHTKFF